MKIQLKLNRSEIKAMFDILNRVDFTQITDDDKRLMTHYIVERIFVKITRKMIEQVDKTSISFYYGEAAAIRQALNTIDFIDLSEYEANLATQLICTIDQKLL